MSLTILVAEDDRIMQQLTQAQLEAMGHHVTMTPDGKDAIAALQNGLRPDFIILDQQMTEMHGMETLQAIKANPEMAHIPVAILSGSDLDNDKDESMDKGACAFITKPATQEQLQSIFAAFIPS